MQVSVRELLWLCNSRRMSLPIFQLTKLHQAGPHPVIRAIRPHFAPVLPQG